MLSVESLYMLRRTVDQYTLHTPYIFAWFRHFDYPDRAVLLPCRGRFLLDDQVIGNDRTGFDGQPALCAGYAAAGGIGVVVTALQGNRNITVRG